MQEVAQRKGNLFLESTNVEVASGVFVRLAIEMYYINCQTPSKLQRTDERERAPKTVKIRT